MDQVRCSFVIHFLVVTSFKNNKKAQGKSHFSALVISLCFIGGYLPSRVFGFNNLSVLFCLFILFLIFQYLSLYGYYQVYYSTKFLFFQALMRYSTAVSAILPRFSICCCKEWATAANRWSVSITERKTNLPFGLPESWHIWPLLWLR